MYLHPSDGRGIFDLSRRAEELSFRCHRTVSLARSLALQGEEKDHLPARGGHPEER
jgi:hypothetical protein